MADFKEGAPVSEISDINFNDLHEELKTSIIKDQRYWLENAAKLRAVNQRVPSYEAFRFVLNSICMYKFLYLKQKVNCECILCG